MPPFDDDGVEADVSIPSADVPLEGTLGIPATAHGLVVFVHGSGSSRFSARNRFVARVLREAGLATLLMDLLSPAEEKVDDVTRHLRFDVPMLAERVVAAIDWLSTEPRTAELRIGLFGASTGGGAALVAAADRPAHVGAVVSRGGRPDLAEDALPRVQAPTLLIVGELDDMVIGLNRRAMRAMRTEVRTEIVAGATHLFEERGALDRVAALARDWFTHYLEAAHRAA